MSSKLRIGVMVASGRTVEGWEAFILSQLSRDTDIEWVAVIEYRPANASTDHWTTKLKTKWRRIPAVLALRIVEAVDKFIGRGDYLSIGDFQLEERYPVSQFLSGIPVYPVSPKESASGLIQRFEPDDIQKIRDLNLDLLIRFSFKILKGPILSAARFGVLSYHHADNDFNRGGPSAFWEVFHNQKQTGATLQVLSEELDGGQVIKKGIYPTSRFSRNANRRRVQATSVWLMIDAIRELAVHRRWINLHSDPRPLGLYCHPLYKAPSMLESLTYLCKLSSRFAEHVASRLFARRQWRILYQMAGKGQAGAPAAFSIRKCGQLIPPRDHFWADPCLFTYQGKPYLFIEDLDRATDKGHVSCFEWSGSEWRALGTVLDCPYHLSYPFVFEHQGRIFMLPESNASNRIELWEADRFPDRWRLQRILFDGVSAADSTILFRDGRHYLFTNLDRSRIGDHGSELHIYWTDDLLTGEWQPHPMNPVLRDCRVARNAGGFFTDAEGRLIRAAQIGGFDYGEGLLFREVVRLSETEYVEETRETVSPSWDPNVVGLHHASFSEGHAVLDSCHRVPRF